MNRLIEECEIKQADGWETITIAEALELGPGKQGPGLLRCPACHGRLIPNMAYSDGGKPHFSHLQPYAYCNPDGGVSPRHPHQLS